MRTLSTLHMEPPQHSAFRGLLDRRFTPRALDPLAPTARLAAVEVIAAAEAHEEIDVVSELSAPFPLTVIAERLGIEETDRQDFRR